MFRFCNRLFISISRDRKKKYNNIKVVYEIINNMEQKEYSKEEVGMCEGCDCGQCSGMECGGYEGCGTGYHRMYGMGCGRHYVLRWILGILILAFVFIAGIKLGEFRERVWGGGYGYRIMDRGYNMMPGYGMMQWRDGADIDAYYRYGMMRGINDAKQATPIR